VKKGQGGFEGKVDLRVHSSIMMVLTRGIMERLTEEEIQTRFNSLSKEEQDALKKRLEDDPLLKSGRRCLEKLKKIKEKYYAMKS
jgi:hypothetical protein